VIDEPRGEYYGGTVAAPVFREIAEASLRYLGVQPSIPSRSIGVERPRLAGFSPSSTPALQSSTSASPTSGMPDLRGLDARAAIARAVANGLAVRTKGSGVVTSQDPRPGEALPSHRRVTLTFSEVRG
jgi:cell division protein FtsI (penicillin-binding protein 3)